MLSSPIEATETPSEMITTDMISLGVACSSRAANKKNMVHTGQKAFSIWEHRRNGQNATLDEYMCPFLAF
jgi:hypothetical protein